MWNNREVSYEIVELELDGPLSAVTVPQGRSGLAFVVRVSGTPVGFFMEPMPEGAVIMPHEVAARVMKRCGDQILREKIHEELRGPLARAALPSLDIAICTHNRTDTLSRCLESLRSIGATALAQVRVLVIDNAPSDDRTARLVASVPGIGYILETKPGLDFARNRAVLVVDRGWLEGLREALEANPDAGAVTGPVLPLELDTRAQILFEQMGGFGSHFDRVRYGRALVGIPTYPCGAGMFGAGCNMVFSRRVLLELGGFDDELDTGAPCPAEGISTCSTA